MTERDSQSELYRRAVLRRGAFVVGATTVGLAGFSGTALATFCPRTPGFWANHDWCEVIADPDDDESVAFSIGIDDADGECPDEGATYCLAGTGECKTMEQWQDFLVAPPRGNKGHIMAKHLLATILNFQRRPGNDRDDTCVNRAVDFSEFGLDETTTLDVVKDRAEQWLQASNFPGDQRRWTVGGVDGEPLKNVLDAFNNANIEELDCNCLSME